MLTYILKLPYLAIIMYFFALVSAGIFIYYRVKNKSLFTFYNISIYLTFFIYFIITPFQFSDLAWAALGYTHANSFYQYLYESICINFLGLIVFLFSELYFENKKRMNVLGSGLCRYIENHVLYQASCVLLCIFASLYLFLIFKYNCGFPLFNGGRAFFYESGILSFVYQGSISVIEFLALYLGVYWINNNKGFVPFIISAFISLSAGSRGPFFLNILYPIILLLIYKKNKKVRLIKLIPILLLILALGLYVGIVRVKDGDVIGLATQILYGNNFSDIRDGAYMLYGFDTNLNEKYLFGKTYLAGLITFLPSYISDFRVKWSYGRFSTLVLFNGGWAGHLGFRGGDSFEAFVNFGILGVIVFSILRGYLFSNVEKIFINDFASRLQHSQKLNSGRVFYMILLYNISCSLVVSTYFRNVYVWLIMIILLIFISYILPVKVKTNSK